MNLNINKYQTQQKINALLEQTATERIKEEGSLSQKLGNLLTGIRNTTSCQDKDADFLTCNTEFQPLDHQLALIASDVYKTDTGQDKLSGEFRRFTQEDLHNVGLEHCVLKDDSSGFQANLYSNGHQVVLAFAGTNDIKDWITNIREALGFPDQQYHQAVTLAKQVHECFGERLVITGHSLGGSLATIAACATGSFAVTFNSAGVSEATLKHNNIDPDRAKIRSNNGSIRTYNMEHDILMGVQNLVQILPDVLGHRIMLQEPGNPSGRCSPINIPYFLEEHKMDTVVSAMPA